MSAPAIIFIALTCLGLGLSLAKHGQSREPENFWHTLISSSLITALLVWGGFFK